MKAKKATQQKIYRENSWGEGKQGLRRIIYNKLTFFDRLVANGSGERSGLAQ